MRWPKVTVTQMASTGVESSRVRHVIQLLALSVLGSVMAACMDSQRTGSVQRIPSTPEQLRVAISSCAAESEGAFEACRLAVRLGLAESGIAIPETELFYARIARAFVAETRPNEALAIYRAAVRRFPLNADLHYELGRLLVDRFDASEEAVGPFTEAVRRRPQFVEAILALALVHYELQHFDEASREYRAVLDLAPESPEALVGLGKTLGAIGDTTAIGILERATRITPSSDAAWTALGQSLLAVGRAAEASAALQKAVAANPEAREAFCALSEALTSLGKLAEARSACTNARRPTQHRIPPCACKP